MLEMSIFKLRNLPFLKSAISLEYFLARKSLHFKLMTYPTDSDLNLLVDPKKV